MGLIDKIFGTTSQQQIKKIMPLVKKINEWEPKIHALKDRFSFFISEDHIFKNDVFSC